MLPSPAVTWGGGAKTKMGHIWASLAGQTGGLFSAKRDDTPRGREGRAGSELGA